MTPIERIRRNRDMVRLARELEAPKPATAGFPRNGLGVALAVVAVLPLVEKATSDPTVVNIVGFGGCGMGLIAALLSIAHGEKLRAIYDGKTVARAPIIPFKFAGAVLLGICTAVLTVFQEGSIAQAISLFPFVVALACLSFGLDPRRNKGLETTDARNLYRLEKIAARVGIEMERINNSASGLAVPDVMLGIRALDDGVSTLLKAATRDPSRLGGVRKHFGIYLKGVADASEKFAAVYVGTGCSRAKAEFVTLLNTLAQSYQEKAFEYAQGASDQLDIEMEVLNGYLQS